ncbi:MAG: 50S ribosomal protein L18 [Candidatus Levybacteria bacterium]|nr:50S ribosomal protein L18 [Candidatus Levybacteria bacterium]
MKHEKDQKLRRKVRIRSKIKRNTGRLRLSVYRSNKYIFAQLIDDAKGQTLVGISEKSLKTTGTKSEKAKALGLMLAGKLKTKKIAKIVFDRGSYAYHGRVKMVAQGLREGGIEF